MSIEVDCAKCGAEYDARHGGCPACKYSKRVEAAFKRWQEDQDREPTTYKDAFYAGWEAAMKENGY
jgi:ribosomal protein L37E